MADWKPYGTVTELSMGGGTLVGSIDGNVMMPQPPKYTGVGNAMVTPPNIPSYLWQSIVATILCCMPFGIVAIIYAAKVDSLLAVQDYVGAQSASDSAKVWVGVSVGIGLLCYSPFILIWMTALFSLTP